MNSSHEHLCPKINVTVPSCTLPPHSETGRYCLRLCIRRSARALLAEMVRAARARVCMDSEGEQARNQAQPTSFLNRKSNRHPSQLVLNTMMAPLQLPFTLSFENSCREFATVQLTRVRTPTLLFLMLVIGWGSYSLSQCASMAYA